MGRLGRVVAAIVLIASAGAARSGALGAPSRFAGAVQEAAAIVKAKAIAVERGKRGDVVTLKVLKRLVGDCAAEISVQAGRYSEPRKAFVVGRVYYVCLVRAWKRPGVYAEANSDWGKIPVDGETAAVSQVDIPASIRHQVAKPTPEAVEAVILWLRGPALEAKAVKRAFRCDEPFELDVTFTNPSRFPITLPVSDCVHLTDLVGAHGFTLSGDWADSWPSGERFFDGPEADGYTGPRQTLPPGASLTIRVKLPAPPLSAYGQDPANARSAKLCYSMGSSRKELPAHHWQGHRYVATDIRLTCPYRRWAANLPRPNGQWAVSIGSRVSSNWRPLVAGPRQPIPIVVGLEPRASQDTADLIERLAGREASALAACFRVEREGRTIPGPKADGDALRKLLARLAGRAEHMCQLDLAGHFAFREPGTYRLRLVLPGPKAPSLSNVLELRVLAEGPKAQESQR